MKLKELLARLGVTQYTLKPGMSPDADIIVMPEESDGFDVKDIIYFQKESQMWLVIDEEGERWFTQEGGEEEEEEGPPDDSPLCEREGDPCTLPEVSGERLSPEEIAAFNRGYNNGNKQEVEKVDICEQGRLKARRA